MSNERLEAEVEALRSEVATGRVLPEGEQVVETVTGESSGVLVRVALWLERRARLWRVAARSHRDPGEKGGLNFGGAANVSYRTAGSVYYRVTLEGSSLSLDERGLQ